MNRSQSKNNIASKIEEIESIYNEFLKELEELKRKQSKIIQNFIRELGKRKTEEIQKGVSKNK